MERPRKLKIDRMEAHLTSNLRTYLEEEVKRKGHRVKNCKSIAATSTYLQRESKGTAMLKQPVTLNIRAVAARLICFRVAVPLQPAYIRLGD